MAIQLSPELEARVQSIMASGNYESVEAVLHTALSFLPDESSAVCPIDLNHPDVVAKLKAMVAVAEEDIAAGRVFELNAEELMAELEEHLDELGFPR